MPIIRPMSDLSKRANEIARQCRDSAEPVFLTRNGQGALVVMSQALYEQREAQLDLYRKLNEAERAEHQGDRGVSHDQLMNRLRRRVG